MELWDILDENGIPKGYTHERGKPVKDGDYHLVVEIIVTTPDKHLLLTFRHHDKPFGNTWEITGGSVVAGEDSLTAAQRELMEETGICVPKEKLTFCRKYLGNHAIYHLYHVEADISEKDVVLQEGETVDARLVTAEEFRKLTADGEICPPIVERHYNDILKELET
mgnify:FL=1